MIDKEKGNGVLNIQPVDGLKDNYLITDQFGNDHEMVELIGPAGHPAHLIEGKVRRIFIGKYQASVLDGKYVTKKNGLVAHSIDFDNSNRVCNELNNGTTITGFHLMTNAEWAAVALLSHSLMNGKRVQGNNSYGKDFTSMKLMGLPEPRCSKKFDSFPARWLAGSGGVTTSHNGDTSGIYDLNGNVWEWVGGLRLNNGEINIIPDAALSSADVSKASAEWRAILEDGSLVEPGTADTLKFNSDGNIAKTTERKWDGKKFKTIVCNIDVSPESAGVELLKKLLVFPHADNLHDDYFWWDTSGENIPIRGGYWGYGGNAGLFYLDLYTSRGNEDHSIGFRVAFVL